ncbi:MAG: RecX family transcriptional regulator [Thiomicrorhabdus sp.]|nr:RecX family transcriptional regulator [Thiomicrorhabdus sp.]
MVDEVLTLCQENNWQSDERYIEQAVRNYVDKGHGPQKIKQKLQQATNRSDLISAALDWDESDWVGLAQQALQKKYGDCQKPTEQKEQAKRMRFLQSRGFAPSTIWKAFR